MSDISPAGPRQLALAVQVGTDGAVTLRIAGELDISTVPQLRTALRTSLTSPTAPAQIRVDLAATSFIDAVGIGALIDGRDAARRAGVGFSVVNSTGIVRRLLHILGLAEALHVDPARRATTRPMQRPGPSPR